MEEKEIGMQSATNAMTDTQTLVEW